MIEGKPVKNLTRSMTPCLVQPQSSITSYYFSSDPILQYCVHEAKRPEMAKLGVQHRAAGEASRMHTLRRRFDLDGLQLQSGCPSSRNCMQHARAPPLPPSSGFALGGKQPKRTSLAGLPRRGGNGSSSSPGAAAVYHPCSLVCQVLFNLPPVLFVPPWFIDGVT